MGWSNELWDGFDRLTEYFHDGIDYYEKYEKFLKERCLIENTYAKSLRKLCKNYEQINQKKFIYKDQMITNEELNKLTFINTFVTKLNEIKDVAGQHELIAENLQKRIIEKVNTHIKTFKDERKKCIDERDKHFAVYQNSDDLLRKSKLKYESAFKDAEKSKEILNRVEQDDNSSRMDIRKQQTIYEQKLRTCDSLKADYANHLCEANKVKGKYYNEQLPSVLSNLQMLEEKRINSYKEYLIDSISIETEVMPRIEKCYKEMMNASNRISPANDVDVVVQLFKTGYKIPTDHVFEDLGEPTSCNSSVNNNNNNESSTPSNSVTSIGFNGSKSRDKKYGTLNPLKKIGIFSKTKTEIESLYDLAPQQQKKELQKKIDQLKIDINKEEKEREGLKKLKDIYTTNQKFGDPQSALLTLKQNEEKLVVLNQQLVKYLDLYQEVELNGGISKTTATLSKQQKSLTLGGRSIDSSTMPRSTSQASVNSSSIPGTPISQHNNSPSILTTTTSSATKQQQQTPVKINKYNENESFDDDDDNDEFDYVNENDIDNNQRTPISNGNNYDSMTHHPKITKNSNDLSSQYEPIDSPPLSSGNSVTTGVFRAEEEHTTIRKDFSIDFASIENEQIIGKALVIYEFKGTVQNAISIIENESLHVLEKDSGDGWTLVKRSNGEKGYVPTDYIRIEYF